MNPIKSATRYLHIGNDAVQCSHLALELREEIKKLSNQIHEFASHGNTEPSELSQLQQLLDFREAVLNWLQMEQLEQEGNC